MGWLFTYDSTKQDLIRALLGEVMAEVAP